jgi:hypothetical protein
MKTSCLKNILIFLALSMVAAVSAGCYRLYLNQLPDTLDMSFQQREKIPLRAGLYMTEDYKNYTSEWAREFGKHVFPIGKMLEDGSRKMITVAFRDMVILSSPDEAAAREADIVIAPEVESADYDYESPSWLESPFSMVIIKWKASDPEGNVIWANTFEGKGRAQIAQGTRRGGKEVNKYGIAIDNFGLAIEDSLRKAYEEISSSGWWKAVKE